MSKQACPIVGIPACKVLVNDRPVHRVGEKYISCVVDDSGCTPLLVPAMGEVGCFRELVARLDGLFLTGSPSNVEPNHYMGDPSEPGTWHDPERDLTALALIPAAIRVGMPLIAVCRGFQEMNVAFGGTLHQLVHELPQYHIHKENPADPLDVQYGPSHKVEFTHGGFLQRITRKSAIMVNSLHSQGVDRLGDELEVEAVADDGLIEGFTVRNAPGFALAMQWHPEWKVLDNPVSTKIFRAYGDACRAYRLRELRK